MMRTYSSSYISVFVHSVFDTNYNIKDFIYYLPFVKLGNRTYFLLISLKIPGGKDNEQPYFLHVLFLKSNKSTYFLEVVSNNVWNVQKSAVDLISPNSNIPKIWF